MPDLITLEWIRERDTGNELQDTDSSTLQDAIIVISAWMIQKIGHDFGSLENYEEEIDGYPSKRLPLTGRTRYPLRSISRIMIDGVNIPLTRIVARTNRRINGISFIMHKYQIWDGWTVSILGSWGYEEIPDDIQEAAYRLIKNKIIGNPLDKVEKSVKHPDGISVTYALEDSTPRSMIGSGDQYVDDIIANYRWKESGGIV